MELFGPSYMVEVIDDGQELGFHVKSNVNLMRLLVVAISVAFVVYGVKHRVWIFAGMSFLGLCSFVRGVIKTTDEWVRANKEGIVADGSLIRWSAFEASASMRAARVRRRAS